MPYRPALDGLRALAVFIVVAYHAEVPGFAGGFLGVDVFFVLSGYLITTLLRQEHARTGRIDVRRFYLRRCLRLIPALLLLLAAYVVLAPLVWPKFTAAQHGRDALIAALFMADYARALWSVPTVLSHTWSLAVEQHFYLIWPLVLLLLNRMPGGARAHAWTLLALYLAATLWRDWSILNASWDSVYFRFDTRLSGLVLGSFLAVVAGPAAGRPPIKLLWAAPAVLAAALCCVFLSGGQPVALVLGVTLVEGASALLILIAVSAQPTRLQRLLSHPVLVRMGVLSYGIYLWHHPLALLLRDVLPSPLTLALVLLVSWLLAAISHQTVERFGRSPAASRGDPARLSPAAAA